VQADEASEEAQKNRSMEAFKGMEMDGGITRRPPSQKRRSKRTTGPEFGEQTCQLHTLRSAREQFEVVLDELYELFGSIRKAFDDVEGSLERSKAADLLELRQFSETGEKSANGQPVYMSPRRSCDPSDYGNGSEAKEATVQEHVSVIERPGLGRKSVGSLSSSLPMKAW
jgi:hypothetical protein